MTFTSGAIVIQHVYVHVPPPPTPPPTPCTAHMTTGGEACPKPRLLFEAPEVHLGYRLLFWVATSHDDEEPRCPLLLFHHMPHAPFGWLVYK